MRQHERVLRPGPRRDARRGALGPLGVTLLAATLVAMTACDPPDETSATTRCSDSMEVAAAASEPRDQVRLLDRALQTCASYDLFTRELAEYPSIIGYDPATFVELRCNSVSDEAVRTGPTCASVIVPPSTAPPTTAVELVYVGDTLDGRRIEIRPSDATTFDGEVPTVIQQTVNIAVESGCDGVIEQRDLWAAQADGSPEGSIASVYAQHAQNVADFIQCGVEPLGVEPADGG